MPKITSLKPTGTWDGPNGTLYSILVTLEDGTTGECNAKSPDRWSIGDDVVVTQKKETQYGVKLKLDRADFSPGASSGQNRRDRGPEVGAQWAINAAIAFHTSKASFETIESTAKTLLEIRDRLITTQTPENDAAPF